jgi:hypothetical protein
MMPFSVVSYIVGPDMTESAYVCMEFLRDGESLSLLLTATLSWEILYIMTRRGSLGRSSRLRHLRCCNMSPKLDVFRCLLVTYLAALRWTISILVMSDSRRGSHTEQAYPSNGLTNDLYACSLTEVEPMFRLRRKKPRVLLALPQMLFMWLSHSRSSLMATPRYFALSTDSKMTVKAIIEFHRSFVTWDGKHVTFIWVKSHLPYFFPIVLVYQNLFAGLGHRCLI